MDTATERLALTLKGKIIWKSSTSSVQHCQSVIVDDCVYSYKLYNYHLIRPW